MITPDPIPAEKIPALLKILATSNADAERGCVLNSKSLLERIRARKYKLKEV